MHGPVALRCALWLLLGIWVGSWVMFGAVVVPAAFRVLPSTEAAGDLVAPVLTALHAYGIAAALPLAILAAVLGRGRLAIGLPLVMGAVCLLSQVGVSAPLAEIRDQAFGPAGNAAAAARFAQLHRLSMGLFLLTGACALVLIVVHARADVARNASRRPG